MDLCAPWARTYIHNRKLEELGMIYLEPMNALTMTGEITKPAPLPQPSTNLWGKQINMSALNMSH